MRETVNRPTQIVTIPCNATVKEAAAVMSGNKVGCLVVNDETGKYAGIITERDVVNRVITPAKNAMDITVAEIMTSHILTCSPDTPTSEAREIMADNNIRHLPIVQDGVVVGMLSARDLMGRQLLEDRAAAEEVAMLSSCLKSIDINEVADIVACEAPKLFEAGKCALSFYRDTGSKKESAVISCNKCVCPREHIGHMTVPNEQLDNEVFYFDGIPQICKERGGQSPRLVIPLGIPDGDPAESQGHLCMCDLTVSAATNRELVSYKARLAREVLTSHLTNARLYQEARLTSVTDALTGVGSRKLLEDKLQAECARAERYGRPFSVAIIDLDNFKTINDILGHATGDDALVQLSACMKKQKRIPDILTRYGGDEFVILMPETTDANAVILMERLRTEIHKIKLKNDVSITVSCGIAQSMSSDTNLSRDVMRRADLALYQAKSAGRDCVKVWDESMSKQLDPNDLEIERIKKLQRRIAGLSEQAETMFVQSIWGLVQALEAKDSFARRHSENVTHYALGIARAMNIAPQQTDVIRRAAMIHDIGKIGIPDTILTKPTSLTPRERSIVEQHPLIAVRILEKMTFLEQEISLVRHHHEEWNGQGYPDGLSEDSIPLGARVLAVADTFDALTSNRSYRDPRSVAEAISTLADAAGYEFDPAVIEGMTSWVNTTCEQLNKSLDRLTPDDLLEMEKQVDDNLTAITTDEPVASTAT
ncbi:MAG: diguanylate cyclase [Sedimentisphaerales bacterium]|nr:diguanylate cyclase [Sedimentisphaerales bacterium]